MADNKNVAENVNYFPSDVWKNYYCFSLWSDSQNHKGKKWPIWLHKQIVNSCTTRTKWLRSAAVKGSHQTWQTEAITYSESPPRRSESNGPAPFPWVGLWKQQDPLLGGSRAGVLGTGRGLSIAWGCAHGEGGGHWCLPGPGEALGLGNRNGPRVRQDVVGQDFCPLGGSFTPEGQKEGKTAYSAGCGKN